MSEVYREFGAKGMEIKVAVITAPINQLHRNIHLQKLMQIFEICVYFMKH